MPPHVHRDSDTAGDGPVPMSGACNREALPHRLSGMDTAGMARRQQRRWSRTAAPLIITALILAGCGSAAPAASGPPSLSVAVRIDPPRSTSVPATSRSISVAAECKFREAAGGVMGATDTGFNLGTVTVAPQGNNLCFFDGRSWWQVNLIDAPIRAAYLTSVGQFESQTMDHTVTDGRFLFGLTGSDDTTIEVTANGTPVTPITLYRFSAETTELPILARVPVTGNVVVTARDSGGAVLQTVIALDAG